MQVNFIYLTVELIVGFIALLLITKLLGKTQISQITPFDFISALILGELVGNAIFDKKIGLHYVLYAVILWALLILFVEKISQKKQGSRSFLEGRPAVVIREGQIDYEALKKNKLDLNQLQHLLRDKDVFSIQDAYYAVLEANGTVNVLKTPAAASPTNQDWMGALPPPPYLPLAVILDGEWVEDNVIEAGITKGQIMEEIHSQKIPAVEQVLYAEWNGSFPLYILTYDQKPKSGLQGS
ncbi:DUF421 domain-containing protein [Bacillus piscicola]|uniref:DUF421 domain-containing protein n=1 Tax=Bacillus piscicola TaxID=1632684 RepID=UPI001F09B69A|nr:DUF421 domain-containing protein [Bacillus piscicola]